MASPMIGSRYPTGGEAPACPDVCPRDLPLLEVYADLRCESLGRGLAPPSGELLQIVSSPS